MTNDPAEVIMTTATGSVTGTAFLLTAEMVSGWAKAGSSVVGFFILCITLIHGVMKLKQYISNEKLENNSRRNRNSNGDGGGCNPEAD